MEHKRSHHANDSEPKRDLGPDSVVWCLISRVNQHVQPTIYDASECHRHSDDDRPSFRHGRHVSHPSNQDRTNAIREPEQIVADHLYMERGWPDLSSSREIGREKTMVISSDREIVRRRSREAVYFESVLTELSFASSHLIAMCVVRCTCPIYVFCVLSFCSLFVTPLVVRRRTMQHALHCSSEFSFRSHTGSDVVLACRHPLSSDISRLGMDASPLDKKTATQWDTEKSSRVIARAVRLQTAYLSSSHCPCPSLHLFLHLHAHTHTHHDFIGSGQALFGTRHSRPSFSAMSRAVFLSISSGSRCGGRGFRFYWRRSRRCAKSSSGSGRGRGGHVSFRKTSLH